MYGIFQFKVNERISDSNRDPASVRYFVMGGLARPGDGAGRTGEKRWSRGTVATSDPVSFNIVKLGNFKATQLFITPIIFGGMAKLRRIYYPWEWLVFYSLDGIFGATTTY